jgi:hypothetical protein
LSTNTFITLDDPSSTETSISGVNNKDQIVGSTGTAPNTKAFQANCQNVF